MVSTDRALGSNVVLADFDLEIVVNDEQISGSEIKVFEAVLDRGAIAIHVTLESNALRENVMDRNGDGIGR